MNDPLDQSQEIKRTRGQIALEKLQDEIVRIKGVQKKFTLQVLGLNGLIYCAILLFMKGDVSRTNNVFTNLFQYQAVAWCCWFMLPYFLRVEAKQDAGMAMAHDSVDLLSKVDEALEPRLERLDALFEKIEKLVDQAEKGEHPLLKRLEAKADAIALDFKAEGRKIHEELERLSGAFTKPIPIKPPPGYQVPGGNGAERGEKVGVP
ncbi:MAG: hypothetical protein ACREDF_01655 [Thermoplasmata archaeon]